MNSEFDVVALGEAMVEFNQMPSDPRQYLQGYGGDTSNAIIAAARAGARCAYVSAVGDDNFGQALLALWRANDVHTQAVAVEAGAPTGIYFVTHSERGHEFSYRRAGSAASTMVLNAAQLAVLERTKWLHYSGISQAISESARAQCKLAVEAVRRAGGKVSFDSNLRLKLWGLDEARVHITGAIQTCDLFLPSWDDVTAISGLADAEDILRWSHGLGAKWVVLKHGENGVWVSDGGRMRHLAPRRVLAVDATGAGDCFAGNLMGRLCQGDDLFEAAEYANAAAALSVQGWGAVEPLPRPDEVYRLLRKHQPA